MSIEFDFNEQKNVCTHTHIENLQKIFTSIIQTMEFGQKILHRNL